MTARLSIVPSGVILLVISAVGMAEDEQLQKYKQIWAAQRPKVESGIIHYKQYTGSNFVLRVHDEVRDLLKRSTERDDYPAVVRDIACTLTGKIVLNTPQEYPELVAYFKKDKVRYELPGGIEIYNDNLLIDIRYAKGRDPSAQITITAKPVVTVKSPTVGLLDFYQVPSSELARKLSITSTNEKTSTVVDMSMVDKVTLIVDINGDILEARTDSSKGRSLERVYCAFKEFDGVRIPQLIFRGTYNDGRLSVASITAIVDASFNVNIDDNIFVQDAKAGDIIVDNRNGGKRPFRADNNIEDVTKH